ncbi:MAG: GNAT family N-acetyltransferase [Phaeodactylibacter sp.]|nr:GNAT family N-acetyltransferase [Phaeodactylibacter sp.]MCB9273758.1 GNAT family N-acetyltransferase [Lewinellaceae bacterium]
MQFTIEIAGPLHEAYAEAICELIKESAKARGTGIAERQPAYIREKMRHGKAVIALLGDTLAGFCYIESWSHGRYVANSGLIVAPEFRKHGLAKAIKKQAFELSRDLYPEARLFGITTSLPVMRINSELGYKPVTFSELTQDEEFWKGCRSCPNFDILERNQRRMCLCTAMMAPSKVEDMQYDLSHLVVNSIW